MRATLEFNLPEDQDEHSSAVNGAAWRAVVSDMDMRLGKALKYGHEFKTADEALERLRDDLLEIVSVRMLVL
jgi:hypothetical protein